MKKTCSNLVHTLELYNPAHAYPAFTRRPMIDVMFKLIDFIDC